jgi:hypothetical protein
LLEIFLADSITTLSNMMKGFINKSENISSKKPRSETISQANKKVVNNTPSRPLLPLEPNLFDTDVMNEFDSSLAFVFFLFTGFVTEVPLITLPFSFTALLGSVVVLFTPVLVFLDSSFLE